VSGRVVKTVRNSAVKIDLRAMSTILPEVGEWECASQIWSNCGLPGALTLIVTMKHGSVDVTTFCIE
jgi:hypothetical protein